MPAEIGRLSPRNALGVIALFVGVVELAFAYPVSVLSGPMQTVLVGFMVAFPLIVLAGFMYVLIRYPENLYSPADFQDPQAFAQLVTRRDTLVQERLRTTTQQLNGLVISVQDNLASTTTAVDSIAKRIAALPQLDGELLKRESEQLLTAVAEAREAFGRYLERQLELYAQHELLGVNDIWFDINTLGSTWSLDFLVGVALTVLRRLRADGVLAESTGEVVVADGDFDRTFEYSLSVGKEWRSLKIQHTGSVCTTG